MWHILCVCVCSVSSRCASWLRPCEDVSWLRSGTWAPIKSSQTAAAAPLCYVKEYWLPCSFSLRLVSFYAHRDQKERRKREWDRDVKTAAVNALHKLVSQWCVCVFRDVPSSGMSFISAPERIREQCPVLLSDGDDLRDSSVNLLKLLMSRFQPSWHNSGVTLLQWSHDGL